MIGFMFMDNSSACENFFSFSACVPSLKTILLHVCGKDRNEVV